MSRDKDYLLGELVDYNQNSVKSRGWQKFLDEVYRNRILWLFGDRKLFERSVELVTLWLRLYTSDIGHVELLYISIEAGPEVSMAN